MLGCGSGEGGGGYLVANVLLSFKIGVRKCV